MNALKNPSLVLLLSLALFAGCHNMGSNLDEFNQPVYIPGYATGFDIRKADGKESVLITVTDPWQGASFQTRARRAEVHTVFHTRT